ncbi:autotransporter outer membrane beta-barrel domain-containing protein [Pseudomonas sp. ADAK2]|uniref:autotransporter outer membrane beta-barrel domain-containing protein n=1 Tax=Pseudomonas TaxID=286 RepID=UPI0014630003|nr:MULTISPECIES: autotransporter outer membrane beta-barrel domain-containing protein [unclassified Pseudomonas]QJI39963.1 autotransporter outer membrane beta-barrel domain-containing protein [Pseudomonas sp. ADAK7]QJI46268.1 autotransporter outer membrane beta-barrel domain-containing protein [Pseudomonas sp. ADAK2]
MKYEKLHYLKLNRPVGVVSCLFILMMAAAPAYSRALLPGESATVAVGSTPESWAVPTGATLNINGTGALDIDVAAGTLNTNNATTSGINGSTAANINLVNSTVTSTVFDAALVLTDSTGTVMGSTLISQEIALKLVRDLLAPVGSSATLTNSTLLGNLGGAAVTSLSTLNLINTRVEGTSANAVGLSLHGGHANASAGSQIFGGFNGVSFEADTFADPSTITPASHLTLDNSSVQSGTGAAISVNVVTPAGQPVLIDVLNGSSLTGGNGNLLEVTEGSAAQLRVNNSKLVGNVDVASGGSAGVQLQNSASLTGNLTRVDSVTVDTQSTLIGNVQGTGAGVVTLDNNSVFQGAVSGVSDMSVSRGAEWNMVGNNALTTLNMNGGSVRLGTNEAFTRLDVVNLSGNGQFQMGTNLATGQTDFLNVTGSATGNHQLLVAATGSEPVSGTPVQIGNIASGDAAFALQNDRVDAGAFTYKLVKDGEGLYLQPDKDTPSSGTQTAQAISATAITAIYGDMSMLNTRLGDRRMTGTQPTKQSVNALDTDANTSKYGVWMRTYGNQYNVKDAYGGGYTQNQTGVSAGVDGPLAIGDGQWLIGAFAGYSTTNLNLKRGSSGSIDSVYLGSYLTWYDEATGYYVDTVAKINRFNNTAKVSLSDGTQTKGDFSNMGVSGSVEVGKHIMLDKGFFIEPSAQLNAAVVAGKDYTLDNGLRVDNDETRSLLGKVGMTVGREIVLDNGSKLQPRLRAAISHEFVNNNRVSVNDTDFNNDLSNTSLELTGGLNWAPVNKKWQVYGELGTSRSSTVTQNLGGSMGVSYSF